MLNNQFDARQILDAMPTAIFVTDGNMVIHEANAAAQQLLGEAPLLLKRLCGEVLHCLHESKSEEGCGTTDHCKTCALRNSVVAASAGNRTVRQRHDMLLVRDGKETKVCFHITATPLPTEDGPRFLLVLEDVTELVELRQIIPICAHCKKIRSEPEYWEAVDAYFRKRHHFVFSHGLCPDCLKDYFPPG